MSDMMDMPPDPFGDDSGDPDNMDPEDKIRLEAFRADADRVMVQTEAFAKALNKLGVYVEHTHIQPVDTPFGQKPALVAVATIGRVAFQERTLDPEAADFERKFKEMEHATVIESVDEERERIKRNIAAGRDPLDDGED